MSDVTKILSRMEAGDPIAASELLPLVYDELRSLAAARISHEPSHSLQATALVHEAYVRLVEGCADQAWNGRRHFFGAAAEAMRRILVEQARRRRSLKRGGNLERVDFDEIAAPELENNVDLIAIDEALTRLADVDAQAAKLVELRYFSGLSMGEAAQILQISERSAFYVWRYARSWLRKTIDGDSIAPLDAHRDQEF